MMQRPTITNSGLVICAAGLAASLAVLVALRMERGEARARAAQAFGAAGVLESAALAQFGTSQGPLGQQAGGPLGTRPRGQYTLLSGRMNGASGNAIFVLDTTNQELVGVKWDRSARKLTGIGYRNLASDGQPGAKGTGR